MHHQPAFQGLHQKAYDINNAFSPRFGCWPYDTIRLLGELGYLFSRFFCHDFCWESFATTLKLAAKAPEI